MSGVGTSRHFAPARQFGRFRRESDISEPRLQKSDLLGLVPCDDLVLALETASRIQQMTGTPPHQEFRTPCADDVMTPASHRGLARLGFRQKRKVEDIAPHLPGGREFLAVARGGRKRRFGFALMNACHFGDELMKKTSYLSGRFSIRRRNAIDTRFTIRFLNFVYSAFHGFF